MATFKSIEWYKKHPEVVVRHHKQKWTDLQIHILLLLFKEKQSIHEMTRMLGRTEYGVLAQLSRQKMLWFDNKNYNYYYSKSYQLYNGKNFR